MHNEMHAQSGSERIHIFQQNMALTPPLALPNGGNLYRGRDRSGAIESLISFLSQQRPQVAALSEMWLPEERTLIVERLTPLYPHTIEGPGEAANQKLDGGLLLLSRSPIIDANEYTYNACLGEDCLAQKGILHGRIRLMEYRTPIDIYLTHLQNPTPVFEEPNVGDGIDGPSKIQVQLDQLAAFMRQTRQPQYPALLLGDLNTDSQSPGQYSGMMARLDHPVDLWIAARTDNRESGQQATPNTVLEAGLTFDEATTFGQPDLVGASEIKRHQRGKRLDYFLSLPGSQWMASYRDTQIVRLESSPGQDSSDHYGLMTEVVELAQL